MKATEVSATSFEISSRSGRRAVPAIRLPLLAIAGVAVCTVLFRPLLPVDETRYLAVAWEMWWRGDFMLPWLNGEPYHHKPPLLFWLIHLGWAVGGVNEIWPRLISPLSAIAAVLGMRALAKQLWPDRPQIAELAPMLAFGSVFLLAYQSALMFDTLLLALLLGSWIQLHRCLLAPTPSAVGWLLLWGSLALLCKGPVALIHLLGPLLAWLWWRPVDRPRWRPMRLPLLLVALASLPLLLWALAASERGGEAFRQALLYGQTLERIQGGMGHPRPVWFYLPFLLLLPLPWSLWPPAWRALSRWRGLRRESAARYLFATLMLASLIHLLVAGKQVHYLIPMLVLGLLLLARLLSERPEQIAAVSRISATLGLLLCAGLILASGALATRYPIHAVGVALAEAERLGRPVAYVGHYQGEFQFAGRLREPIQPLTPARAQAWALAHPDGLLFAREKRLRGALKERSEARFDYKGTPLWFLPAAAFIDASVEAVSPDQSRAGSSASSR